MENIYNNYNSLGFNTPYCVNDRSISTYNSFNDAIELSGFDEIDLVAFIQVLSKGYCFGDRTLVKHIKRSRWMAKPSPDYSAWDYFDLPQHGETLYSEGEIADKLYCLLEKELMEICGGKSHIGILLSGGMDSRITAGVLKNLIKSGKIDSKVIAITWGIENSRDTIYAKIIATQYGWDWEHITLTASSLIENIEVSSELGCEVSPIHLHGIPRVRLLKGLDCILASSFGDSIGRGVYSGRHISKLSNTQKYIKNWYFLMKSGYFIKNKSRAGMDLEQYRKIYDRKDESQYLELEQQAHYMRRLLNPCINLINKNIPTYQTFSSPEIYGFMWSISEKKRNDNIYSIIIHRYMQDIGDIPWSKSGIEYLSEVGNPDTYIRNFHFYHKWINEELYENLLDTLEQSHLDNMEIFNKKALLNAIHFNRKIKTDKVTRIDEIFVWLIAVLKMIEKYNLKILVDPIPYTIVDSINSAFVKPYLIFVDKGIRIGKALR